MPPIFQSASHFLTNSFDHLCLGPTGGVVFGMNDDPSNEPSVSARYQLERTAGLFDQMVEAASKITTPGGNVLVPIEGELQTDYRRQWFLDLYQVVQKNEGGHHIEGVTLGAAQYRAVSPLRFFGQGNGGMAELMKIDGRPHRLGMSLSSRSFGYQVTQRETMSFTRADREKDWMELSLLFVRKHLIRAMLGLSEDDTVRGWPWEGTSGAFEDLQVAVSLASAFYFGNQEYFLDGFRFTENGDKDRATERSRLNFEPAGQVRFVDLFGESTPLSKMKPGENFEISSLTMEAIGDQEVPAVKISRRGKNLWVEQRRRGRDARRFLPELTNLRDTVLERIQEENASLDRSPLANRLALITGAYVDQIGQPRGKA